MGVTGENEHGLRKIMDMTRFISVSVLLLHFYESCYAAFLQWKLTHVVADRVISSFGKSGLFNDFHLCKWIALGFLAISLIGTKGKKTEKINFRSAFSYIVSGL